MEKSKSKRQPKNFFRYFLDEFILFRRDFYYEMDVSSEIMLEKIKAILYMPWNYERRIMVNVHSLDDGWQFDLIAEQADKRRYHQNAKAEGYILNTNSSTILRGVVLPGGLYFNAVIILSIGFALALSWMFSKIISTYSDSSFQGLAIIGSIVAFLLGSAIYFWLRMLNDRNHLYKLIQEIAHD